MLKKLMGAIMLLDKMIQQLCKEEPERVVIIDRLNDAFWIMADCYDCLCKPGRTPISKEDDL